MLAFLRCVLRGRGHNPERFPLGGFKCRDCGQAGADLDEMGFVQGGYVLPVRRIFSREDGGTFTRTASWEKERRPAREVIPSAWEKH
jgi:hypothetical protein